jgi:hypothetical protein
MAFNCFVLIRGASFPYAGMAIVIKNRHTKPSKTFHLIIALPPGSFGLFCLSGSVAMATFHPWVYSKEQISIRQAEVTHSDPGAGTEIFETENHGFGPPASRATG